jgi:hypothetical protein
VINSLSFHGLWFGFPKKIQVVHGRVEEASKRSNNTARNNTIFSVGVLFFQKPNTHPKIFGPGRVTGTKLHTDGPQTLSVTV